ncbi:MAG: hypothetical protein BMS9Abin18_0706 [Zetaproteobacteria bacterium]|nr:MAG: hypothetical protein BMS9Abin18_0706 [Zetaproteobacteria bacterium]
MKNFIMIIMLFLSQTAIANENSVQTLLDQYHSEGATRFDANKGKTMWHEQHFQEKLGKQVSCATCHTRNIRKTGEHVRTGKLIEAMAASVNPERFQDTKKIEKWFKRNCKWTWGRECSPQEKGDFLTFFQSQ